MHGTFLSFNEMKTHIHAFTYLLPHEPEFSTVTQPTVLISRLSIHNLMYLHFPVFSAVFHTLRKLCQPYDNIGEKRNDNFLADPIILR